MQKRFKSDYQGVIGVAWPSIARTFGLPLSMLSVLLVAAGLGYLLTAIPSGHLLHRFGAAPTMAVWRRNGHRSTAGDGRDCRIRVVAGALSGADTRRDRVQC